MLSNKRRHGDAQRSCARLRLPQTTKLGSNVVQELKIHQRRILIDSLEIGIPAPEQMIALGERQLPNGVKVGQLLNSKTLNYKKFTPHRDGLFCERIFGPVQSFVCACGKKKDSVQGKSRQKDIIKANLLPPPPEVGVSEMTSLPEMETLFCPKCQVEYISKNVRRHRLGHIKLFAPVTHIWYLKGRPSYLSLFLGKRKKVITSLAYCNAYLVEQVYSDLETENLLKGTDKFVSTSVGKGNVKSWQKPNIPSKNGVTQKLRFCNEREGRNRVPVKPEQGSGRKLRSGNKTRGFCSSFAPVTKPVGFVQASLQQLRSNGELHILKKEVTGSQSRGYRNELPRSPVPIPERSFVRVYKQASKLKRCLAKTEFLHSEALYRYSIVQKQSFCKASAFTNSCSERFFNLLLQLFPETFLHNLSLDNKGRTNRTTAEESELFTSSFKRVNWQNVDFNQVNLTNNFLPKPKFLLPERQIPNRLAKAKLLHTDNKKAQVLQKQEFLQYLFVISEKLGFKKRLKYKVSTRLEAVKYLSETALQGQIGNKSESFVPSVKVTEGYQRKAKSFVGIANKQANKKSFVTRTRWKSSTSTVPYIRAQSLPFLPSLICSFQLRDRLISFLQSLPYEEDIPIPLYCQTPRRYPLRDVHKFLAELRSTTSTNNSESLSTHSITKFKGLPKQANSFVIPYAANRNRYLLPKNQESSQDKIFVNGKQGVKKKVVVHSSLSKQSQRVPKPSVLVNGATKAVVTPFYYPKTETVVTETKIVSQRKQRFLRNFASPTSFLQKESRNILVHKPNYINLFYRTKVDASRQDVKKVTKTLLYSSFVNNTSFFSEYKDLKDWNLFWSYKNRATPFWGAKVQVQTGEFLTLCTNRLCKTFGFASTAVTKPKVLFMCTSKTSTVPGMDTNKRFQQQKNQGSKKQYKKIDLVQQPKSKRLTENKQSFITTFAQTLKKRALFPLDLSFVADSSLVRNRFFTSLSKIDLSAQAQLLIGETKMSLKGILLNIFLDMSLMGLADLSLPAAVNKFQRNGLKEGALRARHNQTITYLNSQAEMPSKNGVVLASKQAVQKQAFTRTKQSFLGSYKEVLFHNKVEEQDILNSDLQSFLLEKKIETYQARLLHIVFGTLAHDICLNPLMRTKSSSLHKLSGQRSCLENKDTSCLPKTLFLQGRTGTRYRNKKVMHMNKTEGTVQVEDLHLYQNRRQSDAQLEQKLRFCYSCASPSWYPSILVPSAFIKNRNNAPVYKTLLLDKEIGTNMKYLSRLQNQSFSKVGCTYLLSKYQQEHKQGLNKTLTKPKLFLALCFALFKPRKNSVSGQQVNKTETFVTAVQEAVHALQKRSYAKTSFLQRSARLLEYLFVTQAQLSYRSLSKLSYASFFEQSSKIEDRKKFKVATRTRLRYNRLPEQGTVGAFGSHLNKSEGKELRSGNKTNGFCSSFAPVTKPTGFVQAPLRQLRSNKDFTDPSLFKNGKTLSPFPKSSPNKRKSKTSTMSSVLPQTLVPQKEAGSSKSFVALTPPGSETISKWHTNGAKEILLYTGGGALESLLKRFNTSLLCQFLLSEIQILRKHYKYQIVSEYNKNQIRKEYGFDSFVINEPGSRYNQDICLEKSKIDSASASEFSQDEHTSQAAKPQDFAQTKSQTGYNLDFKSFVTDKNTNLFCRRIYRTTRRLKIVQLLMRSKRRPEWMMISVLPVLPPDLRPVLQMGDNLIVASDLNTLYQRVIYRNNRHYKGRFLDFHFVSSIHRLVQDAVDRLIENGKSGSAPFLTPGGRPLKSLSDILKGKRGRFRFNLLGKRVDFSGRSVIVVSPNLKIHECGLPREMALELYKYLLIRQLLLQKRVSSIVNAKKLIKQRKPFIWDILREIIYYHPLLLNRAPTLHRLGIQAFQPKLTIGNAILLHPLVCAGFNADFDGDQMGVHLPLSPQARAEAWDLLWSRNNLLSPATGQPILLPSQDMVLGFYYMTSLLPCNTTNKAFLPFSSNFTSSGSLNRVKTDLQGFTGSLLCKNSVFASPVIHVFSDQFQVVYAYQKKQIDIHTPIWLKWAGKCENGEKSQTPLEIRIDTFGDRTQIYSSHQFKSKICKDIKISFFAFRWNSSSSTVCIRTTVGRVLVNNLIDKRH